MKQKILILIVATVALLGFSQAHAAQVTNIELSYNAGFTIAKISVKGPIRFTHQTEEAKDGRPFRIIVDVLAATHDLGAQTFTFLPDCPIKSIRTSQYAVNPEKIVRIVFDMDSERVYRVDSNDRYITVYFSDNVPRTFAPWSTAAYVASLKGSENHETSPKTEVAQTPTTPQKSAKELNSAIDKDRLASLGSKSENPSSAAVSVTPKATVPVQSASQPTKPVKVVPKTNAKVPAVKTSDKPYGPTINLADISIPAPQEAPTVKKSPAPSQPKVVAKAAPKQPQQTTATTTRSSEQTTQQHSPAPQAPVVVATKPKETSPAKSVSTKPTAQTKPTVAEKSPAKHPTTVASVTPKQEPVHKSAVVPPTKRTETKAQAKPKQATTPVVAQKPAEKTKSNIISTSRFRRAPVESKKIKGTLVAEFPKRLVIKYRTKGYRDPFETLINDAKVDNSPIEKRVPNVEGLKLVGIIESGGSDNRALFEDGDGYGYILATGDKVQKGYVLKVTSDKVYFQIFEYGWSRTVALKLESKS